MLLTLENCEAIKRQYVQILSNSISNPTQFLAEGQKLRHQMFSQQQLCLR